MCAASYIKKRRGILEDEIPFSLTEALSEEQREVRVI